MRKKHVENLDLHELAQLLGQRAQPAAWLDWNAFERNRLRMVSQVQARKLHLRLASKSIRVPGLMKHLIDSSEGVIQGLLTYSPLESAELLTQGFKDVLLAYPIAHDAELNALKAALKTQSHELTLMVDHPHHIALLNQASTDWGVRIRVCLDIDASLRLAGQHLGVRRSSVHSLREVEDRIESILACRNLEFVGVMSYEAQVAGLPDAGPLSSWQNPIKQWIKKRSLSELQSLRGRVRELLQRKGVQLELFNGGGSGSLAASALDPSLTEVAAGSGFFQPHLFDDYVENINEPALYFSLRATRAPSSEIITLQSGGFSVASGVLAQDRYPTLLYPKANWLSSEGLGEVQTPVRLEAGETFGLGECAILRPAKAGEILEHFNELTAFTGSVIGDSWKTYRGLGFCWK